MEKYNEANRLQKEIDAKINEIYMGFEEDQDSKSKEFVVRQKIQVLQRSISIVEAYFNQKRNENTMESQDVDKWGKKIERLSKIVNMMPESVDKAMKNYHR